MKERWPRQAPMIKLDAAAINDLILPLFPGNDVASIEPLKRGLTNSNFKVRLSHRAGALLLRIYQRGLPPAHKEMAIVQWIGTRVPVPHFIHFAPKSPIGHPYAVLDWIEDFDLLHLLPDIAAGQLIELGHSVGQTLAAIHSFAFEKFGFFDADLRVKAALDFDKKGLIAHLRQCLVEGPGGVRLGPELTAGLLDFAAREGHILAEWLQRPCLVHGDFTGSNILLRQKSDHSGWTIAAIIDWEYALSASPALDFGDLFRPPLDNYPAFADAVAAGYRGAGGFLPERWKEIARLADMFSFADILGRSEASALIVEDTKRIVRKLLANGFS